MYKMENLNKEQAMAQPPVGPGFTREELERAFVVEVWGSSFTDDGPDYCVFKVVDAEGNVIATRRVEGY